MIKLITMARHGIDLIDCLNEWIGKAVSWLTLAMVLTTFIIVVLRYFFNVGWIAMQESVTYMHVMVFMLGAAYTLKHDGHVRVDIFYQSFSPKCRAWVDFFGTILLLLPMAGFILWNSWDYVANSWELKESSQSPGGLPGVYLLKTMMLIMPLLLILQGVSLALNSLLTAFNKNGQ